MAIAKKSELFKIDGKPMYEPSSCKVVIADLQLEAYRTDDGKLHKKLARKGLRKVSLTYSALTQEELSELLNQLDGEEFQLTYPDPKDGVKTIKGYCSDISQDLYSGVLYNGIWKDISFSVPEV